MPILLINKTYGKTYGIGLTFAMHPSQHINVHAYCDLLRGDTESY